MKKIINIYVEGEGEVRFISILLLKYFNYQFKYEGQDSFSMIFRDVQASLLIKIRSYSESHSGGGFDGTKIRSLAKEMQINKEKKEINLLIIDADTPEHRPAGGFSSRQAYLLELKAEFKIDFHFFIIPDNSNDGNLETLLYGLVSEKGKPFIDCLNSYASCLSKLSGEMIPVELKAIDDFNKKKFEWYIFNMLGSKHGKETSAKVRDFSKEDLWNLDADEIRPLLNFFREHLPSL